MPFYLRGKEFFYHESGFTTEYNCRLEIFNLSNNNEKKLVLGKNVKIGDNVHLTAGDKIEIGDNCLMASKIYISDISHGDYSDSIDSSNPSTPPDNRILRTNPVKIGINVWIGENVCILPGTIIGDGCVVGQILL